MASLQPVRGTRDILPDEMRRHRRVEDAARAVAVRYGFAEMATPIFEFTDVFVRTLGDTSDIVTKEMYSFERSGDAITLRPENTAGVARAFISNGLQQQLPLKVFYRGPMFRYERPQKGRMRQFHQIGVELLGVADPLADVETIALARHVLEELGVADKTVLELNTLGDGESRDAYRNRLVGYLRDFENKLSEDSRARLAKNPLRILDSKDEGDRRIVAGAPLMGESLNDASKRFFESLLKGLDACGVPYKLNPRLVRGLDYYSHTAFEFTTDALGAQGTVLAGGRYDGLIEQMGGPPTPGIGWAAGVERLALLVAEPGPAAHVIAVIPVGPEQADAALKLTQRLRRSGFAVDLGFSGNVGKRMKRADKIGAAVAILLGEAELARGAATVRNMKTGEQADVPLDELDSRLAAFR
ncbi:MAG: histidine--tRNA ligase [Alphaproteobacteria bacterium]|nr:histidine--tRNA ligase [Alphaproteobacteria bacterium]